MTAMSPGPRRLTRSLVLRPSRARPAIGGTSAGRSWISGPRSSARARLRRAIRRLCGDRSAARAPGVRRPRAARGRGGWRRRRRARRPSMRTISATSSSPGDPLDRRPRLAARGVASSIRKWVVGQRGDLRQVGDADHLAAVRPSARRRSPTARAVLPPIPASISSKTSVRSPVARAEPAEREHDPRELAARGGVAQRRGRHPGVGRDQQLDGLGAVRARSRPGAARARPRAARRPSPARPSSAATRSPSRSPRRAALALSSPRARPRRPRPRAIRASSSVGDLARRSRAARSPRGSARACAITASIEPPCFRFSRSSASRRSSTASSRPGLGLDRRRGRRAGRRATSSSSTRGRAQPLGERVELGVDAVDRGAARASAPPSADRAPPPSSAAPLSAASARAAAVRRPSAWRSARALGLELGLLGGIGRGGLDLGELEAHQVEVALARALALAQLGQLAGERGRLGVRGAVALAKLELRGSPANPSRISSWAEASVSRRCSCWP